MDQGQSTKSTKIRTRKIFMLHGKYRHHNWLHHCGVLFSVHTIIKYVIFFYHLLSLYVCLFLLLLVRLNIIN